jgi:hypothetical protein
VTSIDKSILVLMLFINQFIFSSMFFIFGSRLISYFCVHSVVTGGIQPANIMTTVIHKSRGDLDMATIAGIIVSLLSSFRDSLFQDSFLFLSFCRSGGGQAFRGVILPIESARNFKGIQPCHWAPKTIDNGEKCLGRKIVDLSDSSNGWLILCFSSMSLFDHCF